MAKKHQYLILVKKTEKFEFSRLNSTFEKKN